MRQSIGTSLLILTALIIQTTILPHVAPFRVVPDLVLVVVICIALVRGASAGSLAGFAGGLLRDFLLNAPTGLSALAYLTVGYVVGAVRPYVQSSSVVVPFIGVWAGSLAGTAFYVVLSVLLGVRAEPLNRIAQVVALTALYNTLLVPFAYPVVRRVMTDPRGGARGESLYPGRV